MHFVSQAFFCVELLIFKVIRVNGVNTPELLHYSYISKLFIQQLPVVI